MDKIVWKPFLQQGRGGIMCYSVPYYLCEDPLALEKIQAMNGTQKVSLELGCQIFSCELHQLAEEKRYDEFSNLFDLGPIAWLSMNDYKIVLTGKEYEAA